MSTDPAATALAQLDELHAAGILTDAEYDDAKTRVTLPTDTAPVADFAPLAAAAAAASSSSAAPPPAPNLPPAEAEAQAAATVTPPPAAPSDVAPAPADGGGEAPVADPPPVIAVPCPLCGNPSTIVTTATPAAVPAVDVNGDEVPGGQTVHACPHCGALLEQLEHDVAAAFELLEQRRQEDEQAAAEAAASPSPTSSSSSEPTTTGGQ